MFCAFVRILVKGLVAVEVLLATALLRSGWSLSNEERELKDSKKNSREKERRKRVRPAWVLMSCRSSSLTATIDFTLNEWKRRRATAN
jgi:hypothetical protein